MSFHKEDKGKYVKSSRCLSDMTLESVAEYFENIFNLQVADGSLAKKCKHQIELLGDACMNVRVLVL
jgi:hypothetical protein